MPTLNLGAIASSPAFAQDFTIMRSAGNFTQGGYAATVTSIPFWGIIQVASDEDMIQVPEADRVSGMLLITSECQMYETGTTGTGTLSGLSDTLVWRGQTYKIVKVRPDMDFGFCKAFASRSSGA